MERPRSGASRRQGWSGEGRCAIKTDVVRGALLHLYDLPYLQRHPLTAWLPVDDARPRPSAGQRLQRDLRVAIEQVRSVEPGALSEVGRGYRLLTWRYVEGLAAPAVQARLALSKSQYYRDHEQALAAITSLLRERWGQTTKADGAASRTTEPASAAGAPPAAAPRHNLPCALTSFVGRAAELATLADLLATTRLLTLAGAGGVGKTRLALQLASHVLDRFHDGVWLVDLAPLAEPRLVARAVAAAIGLPEAGEQEAMPAIIAALRGRNMLLVLDNCEHLLTGCAAIVAAVLTRCPDVRVLATSRQSLGITGEAVWRVPSLGAPDAASESLGALASHDAVRLFVDRAALVNPRFRLTERNAAAVALICRQLDGIPLALELAAARLTALSVEQLAARLEHSFSPLRRGSRAAPPRQQTLRATLDWSYTLLDEPERLLFRRLAVFAGGWTLEEAEATGAGGAIAPAGVEALLEQLADKSLLLAEEQPDGIERFRLLEPLRQYGLELLAASGEAGAVDERHARCFLALAEALEPCLETGDRDAALARLEAEQANLRRALGWCCAAGDGAAVELGLRLTGALFWFWYFRGRLPEACRWAEALLALPVNAAAARGKALLTAGRAAWLLGEDRTARLRLQESADLWRRLADQWALAQTLVILGMVVEEQDAAWSLLEESAALFRTVGDTWGLALALRMHGLRAFQRGDFAAAHCYLEDGLALSRALRDRWFVAQTLNHLGDVARRQGDYTRAATVYEESLALFRTQSVRGGIPSLLHNLGHVALAGGETECADRHFRESLRLFREQGDGRGVAHCLIGLAGVLAASRPADAARLLGAAEGQLAAMRADVGSSNQGDYERIVVETRACLAPTASAAAWAEGRMLTVDEALALGGEPLAHAPRIVTVRP